MAWDKHMYRVGMNKLSRPDLPTGTDLAQFVETSRKQIEPWLSAVFQAEHLNLLLGSGFTSAIGYAAGATATSMSTIRFGSAYDKAIDKHAELTATRMKRGKPNIEDQFRSALAVLEGLTVTNPKDATDFKTLMDTQMLEFLSSLLATEGGIEYGKDATKKQTSQTLLQSFLLSFASRVVSRERLHVFTTNYDRLFERGCDLAGLRIIDRFVGNISAVFRASRVDVDMHYNPPGIRGEPRYIEGVVRLTKLHGSLDWFFDKNDRRIYRRVIPFGAPSSHTDVPKNPVDTVMIYPNPAKDVETTHYPYAELFRDFAAAVCRPNAVVVTYGYGFGDDHVNRVLLDMLTIPSTHLVAIVHGPDDRLQAFCDRTREAQVSLLLGSHYADLPTLVANYLPKPVIDSISPRMVDLVKSRMAVTPAPSAAAPGGTP